MVTNALSVRYLCLRECVLTCECVRTCVVQFLTSCESNPALQSSLDFLRGLMWLQKPCVRHVIFTCPFTPATIEEKSQAGQGRAVTKNGEARRGLLHGKRRGRTDGYGKRRRIRRYWKRGRELGRDYRIRKQASRDGRARKKARQDGHPARGGRSGRIPQVRENMKRDLAETTEYGNGPAGTDRYGKGESWTTKYEKQQQKAPNQHSHEQTYGKERCWTDWYGSGRERG